MQKPRRTLETRRRIGRRQVNQVEAGKRLRQGFRRISVVLASEKPPKEKASKIAGKIIENQLRIEELSSQARIEENKVSILLKQAKRITEITNSEGFTRDTALGFLHIVTEFVGNIPGKL